MLFIRFNFLKRISFRYFVARKRQVKSRKKAMKYCYLKAGVLLALGTAILAACDKFNTEEPLPQEPAPFVSLEEVARLFASLPLEAQHLEEVHDAASASAGNGYDEEYRMQDLFRAPGCGVGDEGETKSAKYPHPLRELLHDAVLSTKAGEEDAEAWLDSLSLSDVQIYWPYSDSWNGEVLPIITYDTGDGALRNEGFALKSDGTVEKILVSEEMAAERPVWVMNRNSDADYKSLELRRREDPSWGSGGGDILVKADAPELRTLVLRSFKAKRQFDSWLAGGSEFFCKVGAVEDFTASTEAELRLYEPSITDFMIVVRRSQVGEVLQPNAVLVSEWNTSEKTGLSSCAFMLIEDDGGTRTSWKCSATVKYNSKAYGIDLEIPLYTRDDIVWRGSLTRSYIEKYSGRAIGFGDVELVLELISL